MLPKFQRSPVRPEEEGRTIWQPNWKCFCCQDTGVVTRCLTQLIIPDYDHRRDKPVVCQHYRCEVGPQFRSDENYDQRFTAGICSELDGISRKGWRNTVIDQQKRLIAFNCVKSLRQRDRTPEEEMLAYQKHQAALAEANSIKLTTQDDID